MRFSLDLSLEFSHYRFPRDCYVNFPRVSLPKTSNVSVYSRKEIERETVSEEYCTIVVKHVCAKRYAVPNSDEVREKTEKHQHIRPNSISSLSMSFCCASQVNDIKYYPVSSRYVQIQGSREFIIIYISI